MPNKTMAVMVLAAVLGSVGPVSAQGFGIGPRISFVRGDVPSGTPSSRLFGGTIRMGSSKRVVLELAADYRTERADDGLSRLKERPIQGSLLLFPVRAAFAPYLLAGYGLYSQTVETLDTTGTVVDSVSERKTGGHLGFGAEIFLGRHAALFVDYRYRFVKFGSPDDGAKAIDIPGSGLIPGADNVKLSHRGTMWTSGMAFYF